MAKVFYYVIKKYIREYDSKQLTFLSVMIIAVGWEVFEYSSGIGAYTGVREFLLDSLGDVVGALIMAVIVLL